MGYGQLKVLYHAAPAAEVLKDDSFPDSLKNKIQIVQQIRAFAFNSLGFHNSDNYTTVYDQKGKPILWVLTACLSYELKAKEWQFPILGSFSYKGFFDHEKALSEEEKLKNEGYDTDVSAAEGWSTLGWFNDPILSNMLLKTEGELASIIIHELTHSMLYIKNDVDFNENLANFVGDEGAVLFLEAKYGKESNRYNDYVHSKADRAKFIKQILSGSIQLDSLYNLFKVWNGNSTDFSSDYSQRRLSFQDSLKTALIKEIIQNTSLHSSNYESQIDTIIFNNSYDLPNNTFFMSIIRYHEKQNIFEQEYRKKFNSNLKAYLVYLKNKYRK